MEINKRRRLITDLLELFLVLTMILLIITIYVPRAIWDEEETYAAKSRFYMQNIYNVEVFYNRLTGTYQEDGLKALAVVNAVRDSITADSTFRGQQTLNLDDWKLTVDIPLTYETDYDTTFGFPMVRRDTIIDTTVTIVAYSEELSRNDTSYIQKKYLAEARVDTSFRGVVEENPLERVEVVNYHDSYIPRDSMLNCPVTGSPFLVSLQDDGAGIRVESPIQDLVVDSRYLLFSFKAENHGYINDGSRSWDR